MNSRFAAMTRFLRRSHALAGRTRTRARKAPRLWADVQALEDRTVLSDWSITSATANITLSENGTTETYTGITDGDPYALDDECFADASELAFLNSLSVGVESGTIASGYGYPSSAPGQASASLEGAAQIYPAPGDGMGASVLVQVSARTGPGESSDFGDSSGNGQIGPLSGSGAFLAHIGDTLDFSFSSMASTPDGYLDSYWGEYFDVTLVPVIASPTLVTTASPATVTLDGSGVPTLTDSAVLSGGNAETGSINFALTNPNGAVVDTESVPVNGDGTYTTPNGYTLPPPETNSDAGTYTWTASYSGDNNNNPANDQGGSAEQTVVSVSPASPTLTTTASPAVTLDSSGAPTLSDSAVLAGGRSETGNITFTLSGPGGFSYTQTDPVSDDGTYTASTTLPSSGPVAGTYTWTASYSGDANNYPANDQGGSAEQTVVSPASPTLTTTASPAITLGSNGAPTLTDSAALSGGYSETGNITFTLSGPGGFSYTQTDPVSGDNTYTASATLPASGQVAGGYTWTASYGGDANNNPANDQGGSAEQTVVSPASPTLTTTASPAITLGSNGAPTLTDSAALSGGYSETGNITFTLSGPDGFSYSQTDPVSGDETYYAASPLPTTGGVAGTYTWSASYSGDSNNSTASDQGGSAEQTVVSPASPTLVTTASFTAGNVVGSAIPQDSAVLSGGYHESGAITFTLTAPDGSVVDTEQVTPNGDGVYTTSNANVATQVGT